VKRDETNIRRTASRPSCWQWVRLPFGTEKQNEKGDFSSIAALTLAKGETAVWNRKAKREGRLLLNLASKVRHSLNEVVAASDPLSGVLCGNTLGVVQPHVPHGLHRSMSRAV